MHRKRICAALMAGVLAPGVAALGGVAKAATTHPGVEQPREVGARQMRAAAKPNAVSDPTSNTGYSAAFYNGCHPAPVVGANCDAPALASFTIARAKENLAPMTLPTNFDSLPTPQQLFVLANIDRVDRGLNPATAMNDELNALANGGNGYGVQGNNDPQFPNPYPGTGPGGGNWAGVASSLFAEFLYVYDDGPGSPNLDCTTSDTAGCWGHRHNVLATYPAPLLMGAAEDDNSDAGGQSSAEEFISGDKQKPNSVTWAAFTKLFPVGLSQTALSVGGGGGTATDSIWASGEAMNVTAAITSGGDRWSVSPASCSLAAGHACNLTVTYNPAAGSSTSGVLTVTGPNGARTVSLASTAATSTPTPTPSGSTSATPTTSASPTASPTATNSASPTPPTSRFVNAPLAATARSIVGSKTVHLTSDVTINNQPAAYQSVQLQRRWAPQSTWTTTRSKATDASGRVVFELRPVANASYRILVPATATDADYAGPALSVRVRPTISLHAHRTLTHRTAHVTWRGVVAPAQKSDRLTLQIRSGHSWVNVASLRESSSGKVSAHVRMQRHATYKLRLVDPGTGWHQRATSKTVKLRIH